MKQSEIYFAIRNYVLFALLFVLALSVGYTLIQNAKDKRREKKRNKEKRS